MKKLNKKNIKNIFSLTPMQEGMLFHYLKAPGSDYYFEQLSLRISGEISKNIFERAWNFVIETNEMLRTVFRWQQIEKPVQIVLKHYSLQPGYYDLSHNAINEKKERLQKIIAEDGKTKFDLREVPFRVILCKVDEFKYEMIISNHHILYDGWSTGIILREFFNAYSGFFSGEVLVKPVKAKFKDCVKWIQIQDKDKQKKFWENYLEGLNSQVELSIKNKRKKTGITRPGNLKIKLKKSVKDKLDAFVKTHKITLASLLYSAWGLLLQKYNSSTDVIFGTTISGRTGNTKMRGIENTVGLFINTIPLRVQAGTDERIDELLYRTNHALRHRQQYEHTPLVKVKEYSAVDSNEELFDTVVVIENYPLNIKPGSSAGKSLSVDSFFMFEMTHYDLTLGIMESDAVELTFLYHRERFTEDSIERLAGHMAGIVEYIITHPGRQVSGLEIISPEEKKRLIDDFNNTHTEYPEDRTIHELFEEQVTKTPDRIALSGVTHYAPGSVTKNRDPVQLTYRKLNNKCNRLARLLRLKGIKTNVRVCVMLERSIEIPAAILAISKAGGTYIPIDPEYPENRVARIIESSNPGMVLTTGKSKEKIPPGPKILLLQEAMRMPGEQRGENLEPLSGPGDLIYIIFTSGSTGSPKGAGVYHRGFTNLLYWFTTEFRFTERDRNQLLTSFSFDLTQKNFYAPLLTGGTLCIPGVNYFDPPSLLRDIQKEGVTWLNCTPGMFNKIVEYEAATGAGQLAGLRHVFLGGEPITVTPLLQWLESENCSAEIVNTYGPTECTDICASYRIRNPRRFLEETIPIGRPIYNVRLYVVDKNLRVVPAGVPGELLIDGAGVGMGYISDKDLTSRKFIRHTFEDGKAGRLLYRTGDLAKRQPDGNIEFLGRVDHQVKVRGFRIETGEIENRLLSQNAVKETVVLAREQEGGDKYLCAYIVPQNSTNLREGEIRNFLARELPDYMVPSYFTILEKMPLNPHGKIDRSALPEPVLTAGEEKAPPENDTEIKLLQLWSQVLDLDKGAVGVHDNFFHLGGHSLKAVGLAGRIHKEFSVEIPIIQLFKTPTIRGIAGYINSSLPTRHTGIRPVEKKEYYPLSSAQTRLYILQRMEKTGTGYNMPTAFEISGVLNKDRLRAAFRRLIKRHECLRTSFHMLAGEPVQRVHDEGDYNVQITYSKQIPGDKPGISKIIQDFIKPFDLTGAPLLRVGLAALSRGDDSEDRHILLIDMHHIISDGTSTGILINDFTAFYNEEQLPVPAIQYKDYAAWHNSEKGKASLLEQENYWLKEFESAPPALTLPTDYPRPAVRGFEGAALEFETGRQELDDLKALASKEDATLYMVLLALFNIFLSKISGREEIVVGTPVAGRRHVDLERIIGFFINTLPLKINFPADKSFSEFIREIKNKALQAFTNQDYQYETLVERLQLERDAGRNPLFDVMFVFRNYENTALELPGLKMTPYLYETNTSKFDMVLTAQETPEGISFILGYSTKLFKPGTIENVITYFKQILSYVTKYDRFTLQEIEILPEQEKRKILYNFNDTVTPYPESKTVYQLFEEQVERTPGKVALSVSNTESSLAGQLTYRELNKSYNRLARLLRSKGIKANIPVGIMLERSLEMPAAILAVLKAGGAYLPIDPEYPENRVARIIESSNPTLVLTTGKSKEKIPKGPKILLVEDAVRMSREERGENLEPLSGPGDLIYIIFTSGSTGSPKGAGVYHRGFTNLLYWFTTEFRFTERDRNQLLTSFSFDLTQKNFYAPLLTGGTLCIPGINYFDPPSLLRDIQKEGVTWLNCTPGMFNKIVEYEAATGAGQLAGLRHVFLGGEPIAVTTLLPWLESEDCGAEIVNNYGPTECTGICASYRIRNPRRFLEEPVPVGRPVYNTRLYVVDKYLRVVPVGVVGELLIAGAAVGSGYINDKDMTSRKFIHRRFEDGKEEMLLYRTGDLTKRQPDGNIEFLGRVDHQVKVRGFRIETGEIENRLLSHNAVKETVVVAREREGGDKYLCAYIVPHNSTHLREGEIRHFLARELPDYMVPSYFTILEKMPLNPHGKIDRSALPEPVLTAGEDKAPPENDTEVKLVRLWAQVLDLDKGALGVHDNFFHLGGHSLKAVGLAGWIHKEFSVEIPIIQLFKTPTIRGIAGYINSSRPTRHTGIQAVEKKEYYPLSSAQTRLYILQRMEKTGTGYNMPTALEISGVLNKDRLRAAFRRLIKRHECLRTSFHMLAGEPVQRVHDEGDYNIQITNYKQIPGDKPGISKIIQDFIRPFDLTGAPLLRVGLAALSPGDDSEDRHILLIDMHHIVSDGTSTGILINDFTAFYNEEQLPVPAIQYKDYAAWHNSEKGKASLPAQENYWLKEFESAPPALTLPTDYPRPAVRGFEGAALEFETGRQELDDLKSLASKEDATLYMVLLALFNIFLSKISGREEIVVGTPVAGRRHVDLERIIGFFINTLPLKADSSADKSFTEFVREIKNKALQAFANQDYQYEELVERLQLERDAGRNPLFDVMFVFQNFDNTVLELPGLKMTPYRYETNTSKFDMVLTAQETPEGISFILRYSTKLFKQGTIRNFITYFKQILSSTTKYDRLKLLEIEILPEQEKRKLLYDFNSTITGYPHEETIHGLFEKQCEKTPHHPAVIYENNPLTYNALNSGANRLAAVLKEKGAGPGDIVAIVLPPGEKIPLSILAVLKAGGGYLPIEPNSPPERLTYILEDSRCICVLAAGETAGEIALKNPGASVIDIDSITGTPGPGRDRQEFPNPINRNLSSHMIYTIYTSGTTGKPKGVVLTHKNLVNYVHWFSRVGGLSHRDRALLTSSFAFDLGYTSLYPSLLNGAALYILPKETYLSDRLLLDFIKKNRVSYLKLTPSLFSVIVRSPMFSQQSVQSLRLVLLGGEAINTGDVETAHRTAPHIKIMNHYGPTEAAIGCIAQFIDFDTFDSYKKKPTIGSPIHNASVYILDKYNHLLPAGVPGELCTAGDCLAAGYLNQPQLTAQKFIRHRFEDGKEERLLYRTGDLAKWQPDGNIEFIGRMDHQVKVRGFRIETGEIENRLLSHNGVKETVVVARERKAGDKYLCAYIVPHVPGNLSEGEIRDFLALELPDYMVPSYFTVLEKMPLNPHGKINRSALPLPNPVLTPVEDKAPPENDTEIKLVRLWSQVLDLDIVAIGVHDNFFHLGGHSLKAVGLASRIYKEFSVDVPIIQLFKTPTIKGIARYIRNTGSTFRTGIVPVEKREYYELSSAQRRTYILMQMENGGTAYNMPVVQVVEGRLDGRGLEEAFCKLIQRHDSLRTSFEIVENEPVQKIHDHVSFDIDFYSAGDHETVERLIARFVRHFDPARAPLFRVGLIRAHEEKHILMLDMPHIISDGTSTTIMSREFMTLYDGRELFPIELQYKDYSQWQNSEEQKKALKKQESYWLDILTGELPMLDLPADYSRPPVQRFEGSALEFKINRRQGEGLKAIALESGTTMYMVLLALYNVFLSRLSGREDIMVGTMLEGRRHPGLEKIIGMFVSTLALRNYPSAGKSFIHFLEEVRESTLNAWENQDYPFEELVEHLEIKRDISRNPLFDTVFEFQNFDVHTIENPDLKLTSYPRQNLTAKFDLTLTTYEAEEQIMFTFEYSTRLFKSETINRFVDYFKNIISSVLVDTGKSISEIEIVPEEEKKKILFQFNNTAKDIVRDQCYHQLFETVAMEHPDRIAAGYRDLRVTYSRLNDNANRIAHYLLEKGANAGSIIGIYMTRSIAMLTAVIGTFKAGGALLLIDTGYPARRIRYIMENSELNILITEKKRLDIADETRDTLPGPDNVLCLEYGNQAKTPLEKYPGNNPGITFNPGDLAYMIYTSGTTGNPKGVMVHQLGMINHLYAKINDLSITGADIIAQTASVSFDISIWQFLAALLTGGKTLIIDRDVVLAPRDFLNMLRRENVTVLESVPSLMTAFLDIVKEEEDRELKALRWMVPTGEALTVSLARQWFKQYPAITLVNAYGPTEASDDITHYKLHNIPDESQKTIPIGKPLQNLRIYILDRNMVLCPIGVRGEICVAGIGVGKGYWKDPAKTSASFVPNPYLDAAGGPDYAVLYRTGDIGYFTEDGNIVFMGRRDHQVKIRGNRIELGEVENHLLRHPGIKETVVSAIENRMGENSLCAYIAVNEKIDEPALNEFLLRELPDYMVPTTFIQMERFPLSPSGKIDRKALPEPGPVDNTQYAPPRNPAESVMVEIWEMVLGREPIGIHDNFFALGGNSIETIQIASRLKTAGYKIEMRDIFTYPTIAQLASRVVKVSTGDLNEETSPAPGDFTFNKLTGEELDILTTTVDGHITDIYSLSPMQEGMMFHTLYHDSSNIYATQSSYRLHGEMEIAAAKESLNQLFKRHEIFRTVFIYDRVRQPVQVVLEERRVDFSYKDLRNTGTGEKKETAVGEFKAADRARLFDLSSDVLMRVTILQLEDTEYEITWTFHHILMDGWCRGQLVEEYFHIYHSILANRPHHLPEIAPYRNYIQWLEKQDKTKSLEFWAKYLEDYNKPAEIRPAGGFKSADNNYILKGFSFFLEQEETERLHALARGLTVTVSTVIQAAWGITLAKYTGTRDVVFGLVVSGRPAEIEGIESMIGLFINTIPIRVQFNDDTTLKDLLKKCRDNATLYNSHQYCSLAEIQADTQLKQQLINHIIVSEDAPVHRQSKKMEESAGKNQGRHKLTITRAEGSTYGNYDFGITVIPGKPLRLRLDYNANVYEKELIEKIAGYYTNVLKQMAAPGTGSGETTTVNDITLLSQEEKDRILVGIRNAREGLDVEFEI